MGTTLKGVSFLGLTAALILLWGTATAQETQVKGEKAGPEVATLSFIATGGGCRGDGPFCCIYDQKNAQEALEKVEGVIGVDMDGTKEQVRIDYERGKLNLSALVQGAKKAGHELILP